MECCGPENKQIDPSKEKIILIGNPNVGKSVIFNYLTGKYVTVSNYPGTTVEVSTGTLSAHGKKFQVLDTPGVNSLIPMSEDEKVTRDILLKEPQSYLIQVIDTKNIRRGLLISLQLFEMGLPFIVLLNMWEEAIEADGSRIISLLPESPISRRSLALMVLSGDETLVGWLHKNLSAEKILQIEKIRQE